MYFNFQSSDKTLFFFANKNNLRTPIGFVNLPSPITYMTWSPREYSKSCLLVCMEDGSVFEYEEPVPGKYDTTKTYLIEMSLKCRKYKFKSIKSRLRVIILFQLVFLEDLMLKKFKF